VKVAPPAAASVLRSRNTRQRQTQSALRTPSLELSELAWLEREVVTVADREQQRIGRDLHDSLGQDLVGIALTLKSVLGKLEKENSQARPDVEGLATLVDEVIESTHELARGLLGVRAEPGALAAALEKLSLRARAHLQVETVFIDGCRSTLHLNAATATHLYRIAQEAVMNAVRHGHATRITVRLSIMKGELKLTIDDNGTGFVRAAAAAPQGLGRTIMRYRARMVGAELFFETLAGGGARVLCKCPITDAAHLDLSS
jgi:two-component system sensor kinase FixL